VASPSCPSSRGQRSSRFSPRFGQNCPRVHCVGVPLDQRSEEPRVLLWG
jgi:hypothetical protein